MNRPVSPLVWRPTPPRNPAALAVTAAAAIVVSIIVAWVNRDCIDLVIASSNEKSQLLADIAESYEAQVDRRCVDVKVIEVASGAAERALRRDWAGEAIPRPHVWSPASKAWLGLLTQHRSDDGHADILPRVAHSLIYSPLVIAMPEKMANALPSGKIGWEDMAKLAGDPEGWARYGKPWGRFKLGKTNPTISTSGLHALISVNYASQRTPDSDAFVRAIESSVVHYGDSVRTFLTNLRDADKANATLEYVSAVAIEEKQVYDYDYPVSGLPPSERLKALHPTDGTLVADHPYAILNWTDPLREQAAADFERYLTSTPIQTLFQQAGFRNYLGQPGDVLQPPYFDRSVPREVWEPPDARDLIAMLGQWEHVLRKPAHALFVVDVGRPMSDSVAGTGATKLDVATRAASEALGDFAPRDAVGLWTFPTTDGSPYRVAAPTTTIATSSSALVRALPPVNRVGEERAFYQVVRASVDEVRRDYDRDRINAVVVLTGGGYGLTDKTGSDALVDYLQHQPVDQRVRLYIVAYGPTSNDILRRVAESSGGAFYDATTDQVNITEQLRNAMSNF